MDEEIRKLLDEEIKSELEDLDTYDPGSEEKQRAIEGIVALHELRMKEAESKKTQGLSVETYIKFALEAAGIIAPMIFYGVWMKRGFKFEEKGTYTSTTFRGLFNRFKPTNK